MNAEELEHQQREREQAQAQAEGTRTMGNTGLNPFAMQSAANTDTQQQQQQQQQQNDYTTAVATNAATVVRTGTTATTTASSTTTMTTFAAATATSQSPTRHHFGKGKSLKQQQQSGSRRPTTKKAASKKKRRSSKHVVAGGGKASTAATAATATTSAASASKRRGGLKRRSSSSSLLTTSQQYQKPYRTLKVLSDAAPSRLVNPLTEWPPAANDLFRVGGPRQVSMVTPPSAASVAASAATSSTTATTTTTTTTTASTSNASAPDGSSLTTSITSAVPSKTSTTASMTTTTATSATIDLTTTDKAISTGSPTDSAETVTSTMATTATTTTTSKIPNKMIPTATPARSSDFIPLLDLWHARPDSYSLRYMASLLGLDLTKLQQQQQQQQQQHSTYLDTNQNIRAQIQQCLPDATSRAKDPAFVVPPEGKAMQMITDRNKGDKSDDKDTDDDMSLLGQQMDPLYMQLLHGMQRMTGTRAAAAAYFRPVTYQQYQKLGQMALPFLPVLQDMAHQCGLLQLHLQLLLQSPSPTTATTLTRLTQQHQQLLGSAIPLQRRSLGFMVTTVPESVQQDNVVLLASVVYEIEWFHPTGSSSSSSSASSSAITSKRPTLLLRLNHLSDHLGRSYLVHSDSGEDNINPSIFAAGATEEINETTRDIYNVQEDAKASSVSSQKHSSETGISAVDTTTTATTKAATTIASSRMVASTAGAAVPTSCQEPVPEGLFVYLIAIALEHARASGVAYAVMNAPHFMVPFLKTYFRMVPSTTNKSNNTDSSSPVTMVCDLYKCSYRYAFMLFRQRQGASTIKLFTSTAEALPGKEDTTAQSAPPEFSIKERWLARLPTQLEVAAAVPVATTMPAPPKSPMGSPSVAADRSKRALHKKGDKLNFTGATGSMRDISIQFRAKLISPTAVACHELSSHGVEGALLPVPDYTDDLPSLDILRTFSLDIGNDPSLTPSSESSEILQELLAKQQQLEKLESGLQASVESLFEKVVLERIEYESGEAIQRREREQRVLAENVKMLQQRKDQDEAFQAQLEQDMDAVCCICNDGEVTPDNQILFCESCNCAVHQVCYGVDRVPEGDYFCLACTRLGRDKRTGVAGAPLPICCELCPLKQGAFIETDTKPREGERAPFGKFVHVVCGKWQGLGFAHGRTDLIEDVTDLKIRFRQHKISCSLCQGERGCMNKCRVEGCERWQHVTCARASGLCEVIHGENCKGGVEEHPWTLLCPEHSKINPENVPKDALPVERLIVAAKSFPPEPKPPPVEVVPVPFNTVGGEERKQLLLSDAYEQELLLEITTKKLYGFRCEICDQLEEDGRNLVRCSSCSAVCCVHCLVEAEKSEGSFKCAACRYIDEKKKAKEELETPQCIACCQKGGLLREAYAVPINKKTQWRQNQKDYQRSLFGKPIWVHHLCEFWIKKLKLDWDTGKVDCSQVILSNGKGLISNSVRCYLCGRTEGLKEKCDHDCCKLMKKSHGNSYFHVSCARQAGLEVNTSNNESRAMHFYVRCYRHGGNNFNLRAKLEDLLEMEKRRSGKELAKYDLPMTFAHAQRLLNSSIQAMRMLGWSWRWAEWWVDYDSSWEPLLEPGQKESQMTKEELKIVDSTRETRCEDARKCRLAAFGAALQERKYDTEGGFDRDSLERALRAILSTKSLVGPLERFELEFLVDWLGRAYRSRSRLLGYGEDRICPSHEATFCLHISDQTPKYQLGNRTVPGKQILPPGAVYETGIEEVDDFLKTDVLSDEPPQQLSLRRGTRSAEKQIHSAIEKVAEEQFMPPSVDEATERAFSPKRSPGRPPSKNREETHRKGNPARPPGNKRKRSLHGTETDIPRKRGPGRPPTRKHDPTDRVETADVDIPKKRGPGRPPSKNLVGTVDGDIPKKRGPGRPPSKKRDASNEETETAAMESPTKSGSGRPAKKSSNANQDSAEASSWESPTRRRPGRPPNKKRDPSQERMEEDGRVAAVAALVPSAVRKRKQTIPQTADQKGSSSPTVPTPRNQKLSHQSPKKVIATLDNTNNSTESADSPVPTPTSGAPMDAINDTALSMEELDDKNQGPVDNHNTQTEGKGNATLNETAASDDIALAVSPMTLNVSKGESKDDKSTSDRRQRRAVARYGGSSNNDEPIETQQLATPARALTDEDQLPLSELVKRRRLQKTSAGTAAEESKMKPSNILFAHSEKAEDESESPRKQARDHGKAQAMNALLSSLD